MKEIMDLRLTLYVHHINDNAHSRPSLVGACIRLVYYTERVAVSFQYLCNKVNERIKLMSICGEVLQY